ncbi:hypothetical protein [Microbacterium maritypicum]
MSYSIEKLRSLSDEELIAQHDHQATMTSVGVNYYLDELDRRSRERAVQASDRLARRSFMVGIASTVLSVIATVAAVLALFLR